MRQNVARHSDHAFYLIFFLVRGQATQGPVGPAYIKPIVQPWKGKLWEQIKNKLSPGKGGLCLSPGAGLKAQTRVRVA